MANYNKIYRKLNEEMNSNSSPQPTYQLAYNNMDGRPFTQTDALNFLAKMDKLPDSPAKTMAINNVINAFDHSNLGKSLYYYHTPASPVKPTLVQDHNQSASPVKPNQVQDHKPTDTYRPPRDDTAQRVLSKNTTIQYQGAIGKLQSKDPQLQKQGAEELLQIATNSSTGTEQDKQEVQELILANSKTPPTKEKVNNLSLTLGIAPAIVFATLFACHKIMKHKRLYGKTKIPPRLLSEVVCLYREGYLSRDNALLALKVLKS